MALSSSGINLQLSTKSAVGLLIALLTILGVGNFGANALNGSNAVAEKKIEEVSNTLDVHIATNEDDNDVMILSLDGVKREQTQQRLDIKQLEDLLRNNSEQLNRILGRMEALLDKDRL